MGACGCGDDAPDFRLPVGPDTWTVSIYAGCRDCNTGPGLIIGKCKEGSGLARDEVHTPPVEWTFTADNYCERAEEIISPRVLETAVVSVIGDDDREYIENEYDARGLLVDIGRNAAEILTRAIMLTAAERRGR